MDQILKITVNGVQHTLKADPQGTLLSFLRDKLGLMGTKNGCNKGHCGSCTVIINGESKRACLMRMAKLDGAIVETIESLAEGNELHPLQKAFMAEGAVQCGFCTPGMIMAAKALLDKTLTPSDPEIKEALKYNFCRCTGYAAIIRAVRLAANMLSDNRNTEAIAGQKEKPVLRKDALAKVTGIAVYADDMTAENMLYGKLLFSEFPHAEISSIDTSEAEKADGVAAVMTAKDIPGRKTFGLFVPQQQVLAEKKVRYMGDPVAVVFAETPDQAEKAITKIKVCYNPLPGVFSPLDGMKEDAPKIYDDGNLLNHVKVRKGDVEKGFAQADIIVEGEYSVPMVEHAYLEVESSLSKMEEDGTIVIYTGSQSSFAFQDMIAQSLKLPKEKVRVILTVTGGAFGGKEEPTVQIHCALGTLKTGRPVKMTLTREESIRISTKRHAEHIYMKHGATRDGKLVAVESRAICDAGAYMSVSSSVVFRSAVVAAGPYEIPNAKTDAYGVFTNNNPGGAFRGFGSTQVAFAAESQMDKLARALHMDPIEFRLKNALTEGKTTITGQVLRESVGFVETIIAVKDVLQREDYQTKARAGKKIGVGIAGSYKNVGIGTGKVDGAGAKVELGESGQVVVRIGATENGQGSDTAMAIIAAKTIGIDYDMIDVLSSDTKYTPDAGVTTASRQTFITGNAVMHASTLFRNQLFDAASQALQTDPGKLRIGSNGTVTDGHNQITLNELFNRAKADGSKMEAFYYYDPPETHKLRDCADHEPGINPKEWDIHYAYCFGTQAAIVEVDETTGEVNVLKIIAAQDAGKAIHPQNTQCQIEGAVMMGVGYALSEEYRQKDGLIITDNLNKLKVPSILKAPEIEPIIVEKEQSTGPFGAKGMGEVPINPTAPAIINAIYDAIGARIQKLPATKEDVLEALKERDSSRD